MSNSNLNKIKKISKVESENYTVKLVFEDGERATVSLSHIFSTPKGLAKEILRGSMFDQCFIEHGALAWPNGLELCPDAIKMWAEEQEQNKSA